MTTTVNDLILQSDKGKYSLKGEGMTLELSDDKLNFSCGGNEQTWDVETISEISTTSNDNAYQLVVCAEKDTVLFSTNNELQLLNSAEALANQLEVRFSVPDPGSKSPVPLKYPVKLTKTHPSKEKLYQYK